MQLKPFRASLNGTSPDVFAAKYNVVPLLQETKNKLSQVTQKLKESREEGLQIRADCQAMIKQYQVRFYWQSFHLMSLKDVFTFMHMYIVSVLLTSLPLPLLLSKMHYRLKGN